MTFERRRTRNHATAAWTLAMLFIPSLALAQGMETSPSGAVSVSSAGAVHAQNVDNAGTITLTGGQLFVSIDLDNSGTVSADDASLVELDGSANQTVISDSMLTLGKLRVNNSGASGSNLVTLFIGVDAFQVDVNLGVLKVCNFSELKARSTSTSETDPMVAVRAGGTLHVDPGSIIELAGGKMIVYADVVGGTNGLLKLDGTASQPATIDAISTASPYGLSVRGDFDGRNFRIFHPDANGLQFKTEAGRAEPRILQLTEAIFDFPATNGTLFDLSLADPIRVNDAASGIFDLCIFENTAAATGPSNVRTSTSTSLKKLDGTTLDFITFTRHGGSLSGEANDDEPAGVDLVRWGQTPDDPTNLDQRQADGLTSIPLGGTTNENTVTFFATVTSPDSNQVQLQVEVKSIGVAFDGLGVETSGLVSSGSTAQVTIAGLGKDTYHWRARTRDEFGVVSNWVNFGNNAESAVDFEVTIVNAAPSDPAGGNQYRSNGIDVIALGGVTLETTVIFKATVSDPDLDQVKLQIELRPIDESFDGQTKLFESTLVASGNEARITVTSLAIDSYHWRFRAIDEHGHASPWRSFGGNFDGERDFRVDVTPPAPQITTPDKKTNDDTPIIEGTAEANATVQVFFNGVFQGTTTADGAGNWTFHDTLNPQNDGVYVVTAKQTVGMQTSSESDPVNVEVDTTAPAAPSTLRAIPLDQAVLLQWTASPSPDVLGYRVYRKGPNDPDFILITPSNQVVQGLQFKDTGLTNGQFYEYKVTAVDDALNEGH